MALAIDPAPTEIAYYGEFPYSSIHCPRCGSSDIWGEVPESTTVGWVGGPENDPNHWQARTVCRACRLSYDRHWVPRGKKSWATVRVIIEGRTVHRTIAGWPGCCERTFLVWCTCGTWIPHRERDGREVRRKEHVWDCPSCGASWGKAPIVVRRKSVFDRLREEGSDVG